MDSNTIQHEVEQLDHQRDRIREILAEKIVSADMARDLKRRLDAITRRMTELSAGPAAKREQNVH